MTTSNEFNRIEDCGKIDPNCIDAYLNYSYNAEEAPTTLCVESSWGGGCIDLEPLVKAGETVTTLYLSPEDDPNCLVFEREDGESDCIHGDDLSRIISMQLLKDVDQADAPRDGIVYMYNSTTNLFEPYDLKTTINNINVAIQNINATLTNHENRLQRIEAILTPPADAPDDISVAWSNINVYSDPNVVISEGSGTVTTLNKNHGVYSHLLNINAYGDEIFG